MVNQVGDDLLTAFDNFDNFSRPVINYYQ